MKEITLLACPFCGGCPNATIYKDESLFSHNTVEWYQISCRDCDVSFSNEDEDEVITKWNTRV